MASILRIGGLVVAPRELDFAALRALPHQQRESSALLGGCTIFAVYGLAWNGP